MKGLRGQDLWMDIQGKSIPGQGSSQRKCSEVERQSREEINVPRAEWEIILFELII